MALTAPVFSTPTVQRYKQGAWQEIQETLAQELSVELHYAHGRKKLWAWPQNLEQLMAGHVLLDCLPAPDTLRTAQLNALSPTSADASCAFQVSLTTVGPLPPCALPPLKAQNLLDHMTAFIKAPGLWDNTGCFHRAAMLDSAAGTLIHVVEDIGRHNCVDRLAGYAALQYPDALHAPDAPAAFHPSRFVLLISSRITASLYHKARRAGFTCMVSRSAVTSGSRDAALADGTTLLGFCRPEDSRLTVFADARGRVGKD